MRESLRVFRTQPGFATVVVLVLALCTGANSALFTVVNALLLRPLPFPHSEQLVEVSIPERDEQLEDLDLGPGPSNPSAPSPRGTLRSPAPMASA